MQLNKKLFIIFAGRFHPWHKGHKGVYDYLSSKYGGHNVYITSTDKVELPKSPFTFDEKRKMMVLTGVPLNKIINVRQNYNLENLVGRIPIDIKRDSIIFAVSEKDMSEDPRFSKFVKKDGSPSYLQPLPKKVDKLEPAIKRGYIDTVPTTDFTVFGMPARSASQLRSQYAALNSQQRKLFINDLFGTYDDDVYNIMNAKLSGDGQLTESQKSTLKKLIVSMINEDQSAVDSAIKKANDAFKKRREEEFKLAKEKLKVAEEKLKIATTPEEKDAANKSVEDNKKAVKSAEELYKSSVQQSRS